MKIVKVETIHVSRFMFVKVITDEGIVGIGELHPASGTRGMPYPLLAVPKTARIASR